MTLEAEAAAVADAPTRGTRTLGAGLVLVVSVCTLWLGVTGQLPIYVNPGNTVFAMTMSAIAVIGSLAALAMPRDAVSHDHDDEHVHVTDDDVAPAPPARPSRARATVSTVLHGLTYAVCFALALAFLVLPPTALSAATAEIRDVNGGMLLSDPVDDTVQLTADADYSSYGLREWAALLRQSTHPESLIATPFGATGFITESDESPDAFVLTRFVVTHCAIDAQPVGVTVHMPGWRERFDVGSWVTVDGAFASTPDGSAASPVSVVPEVVEATAEPDVPYEY